MDAKTFIAKLVTYAQAEMTGSKLLASVTIAQAALESGWDTGPASLQVNNLFGVLQNGWPASQCFAHSGYTYRKYPSWQASVQDRTAFLKGNLKRYGALFGCTDYKKACELMQSSGWPGNSTTYAAALISIINEYDLTQYDVLPKPAPAPVYPVLKEGSTGSYVVKLQTILKIKADGIFGPQTLTAVKAFQKAHKLTADGIVGPQTWAALLK